MLFSLNNPLSFSYHPYLKSKKRPAVDIKHHSTGLYKIYIIITNLLMTYILIVIIFSRLPNNNKVPRTANKEPNKVALP